MSRLPTPGSDDNTWGDILNDFLGVTHNTDGSLKTGSVTTTQIADGTITTTDISSTAGIVKTQLASAVQTSLGKADTALQSVPDATTTSKGQIQLAGDLAGTAAAPLVAKLNGVTLGTTAPTAGQVLLASSGTAAAWGTATATDSTKVAKSGDTMTGTLTMPNLNAIKTPTPTDIYQWFYSDATAYNQVPFGEIWHDLLAFNKLWTVTSETSTDGGSTWTSATVNKKLFAHLERQSIQILDGTVQGIRWTFSNVAYSTGRWLLIAYTYIANQPSATIYVQSSSDGSTWTNRHNSSYSPGVGPVWHYVQDVGGDTYMRIMIQAGAALSISGIRFYSSRWGDQGAGKELEQPYTWNENGYIGIGKGKTAPSYTLDVSGDASVAGQIHNVTDPTSAQDVATKAYVDAGGGNSGVTLTSTQTVSGLKTFANDVKISGTSGSNSTLIYEDQTAAPTGTFLNSASYVTGSYTLLTTANTNLNGEVEYTVPLSSYGGTIDATFDIYAGGGTGANGLWFYAGSTISPTTENAPTGYSLYFSDSSNAIYLNFNGTNLTSVAYANLGNATWRTMRLTLTASGSVTVYVNGTSVMTYSDSVRTLPGTKWGFGARTGTSTNEHRLRNVNVTTVNPNAGTQNGLLVGSVTIRNGRISNVTDPANTQDVATKAYVDSASSTAAANTQTANYTLVRTDAGKTVEMNLSTVNTVTIPANASVAFPVNSVISVAQIGNGRTSVTGASGVTLDLQNGTAVKSRYGVIQLRQRAINEWVITGAVSRYFDPTTITGLTYRMRASTIGVTTDGSSVSSAPFEIGGISLSSSGTAQPLWRMNGVNGRPYLSFNGTTTSLSTTGLPTYNQPVTICVIAQVWDGISSQELIKMGGLELLLNQSANTWSMYSGSLVNSNVYYNGVISFTSVFGAGGTQGAGQAYTSGTLTASGGSGSGSTSGGDLYLGAHPTNGRYATADIYEVLIFTQALTATDLRNLTTYVQSTYF